MIPTIRVESRPYAETGCVRCTECGTVDFANTEYLQEIARRHHEYHRRLELRRMPENLSHPDPLIAAIKRLRERWANTLEVSFEVHHELKIGPVSAGSLLGDLRDVWAALDARDE